MNNLLIGSVPARDQVPRELCIIPDFHLVEVEQVVQFSLVDGQFRGSEVIEVGVGQCLKWIDSFLRGINKHFVQQID